MAVAPYAVRADWSAFLNDINNDTDDQDNAILVASGQMNSVFRAVLIKVVPIDLAAFDSTDPGPVQDKAELTEWLKLVCLRLAAEFLTTGSTSAGKKVAKDAQWAKTQLDLCLNQTKRLALVAYDNQRETGSYQKL